MHSAAVEIRALLVDEQSLFRQAMRRALEAEPDFDVVGEAGDGLAAIGQAEALQPDVIVMGAFLPQCDGLRATSLIKQRMPTCQVLMVSGEDDPITLLHAIEAGAAAFVTKSQPLTDLVAAARAIRRGSSLLPSRLLGPLISGLKQRVHEHDDALGRLRRLSNRELEVLALLTEGCDNEAIAARLVISPETARTHVQNVLTKLRVHSRLEAAAFVARNGLTDECWTGLLGAPDSGPRIGNLAFNGSDGHRVGTSPAARQRGAQ
jgi:DNA-binding NarL/FixJ family response regulator